VGSCCWALDRDAPGLHPGQHRDGAAETFEAARADFEAAWAELLPAIAADAFEEWRRDRDWRAEAKAKRARGEKPPSEIHSTMRRCVCGATYDEWSPADNQLHAPHIYAAQAGDRIVDEAIRVCRA
jgi:hypothetical protein